MTGEIKSSNHEEIAKKSEKSHFYRSLSCSGDNSSCSRETTVPCKQTMPPCSTGILQVLFTYLPLHWTAHT